MSSPAPSIGEALRAVRRTLGVRQEDLAERLHVARETISVWERGRGAPTHQQRVFLVKLLGDVAPEVLLPLVQALGVSAPPGARRASAGPDATTRALAAVRAAADELDVPASALRQTIAVVLTHLAAAGVGLDDAAAALAAGPKGAATRTK